MLDHDDDMTHAAQMALARHGFQRTRIEDTRVGCMSYAGMTITKMRAIDLVGGRQLLVSISCSDEGVDIASKMGFIQSHLLWLEALCRGSDIVVQTPVRNDKHDLVTLIPGEGGLPETICTVVHWITGEELPDCGGHLPPLGLAERMGGLCARLHSHAERWTAPPSFERHVYDIPRIRESFARLRVAVDSGCLSDEDHALLLNASPIVEDLAARAGQEPAVWGVAHGDFANDNCVVHEDEVLPIDFDFCFVGHYMREVARTFTLMKTGDSTRDDAFRSAFRAGYEAVRPLSDSERRLLAAYMVETAVDFWADRPADWGTARELAEIVSGPCRDLLGLPLRHQ